MFVANLTEHDVSLSTSSLCFNYMEPVKVAQGKQNSESSIDLRVSLQT